MKKKIIIIFLILIVTTTWVIAKNYKKNEVKIDFDYSNLKYDEIFYQSGTNLFGNSTSTYCIGMDGLNNSHFLCISVLDEDLKPISEAKVKMFNSSGNEIITLSMNSQGRIAFYGLQDNSVYYLKQTETREGYQIDTTVYRITTESKKDTFDLKIFNSKETLSDDEIEDLKKSEFDIIEQDEEDVIMVISEETKNNMESAVNYSSSDRFAIGDLKDLNISIYTRGVPEEEEYGLQECSVHIDESEILSVHVEDVNDDNDVVQITDIDVKPKNDFQNNENFYVKYYYDNYKNDISYLLNIVFRHKNKTYKISKMVGVGINKSEKNGYIDASFKDEQGNPMPGARAILKTVDEKNGNESTLLVGIEVGDSGKLFFSRLPAGTYKLIKNYDNKNLSEKIVEVKSGETTNVEL